MKNEFMDKRMQSLAVLLTIAIFVYPPVQFLGFTAGREFIFEDKVPEFVNWERLFFEIICLWIGTYIVSAIILSNKANQKILTKQVSKKKRARKKKI